MPRVAARKRTAPPHYDPLAVRPPVPHQRDTRQARRQRPRLTIQALPRDVLALILAMVPWTTTRGVCRRWAVVQPMPRRDYLCYEAYLALTRVERAILVCSLAQIESDVRTNTHLVVEYDRCYSAIRRALLDDDWDGVDKLALGICLVDHDWPASPRYMSAKVYLSNSSLDLRSLFRIAEDDHLSGHAKAMALLDANDGTILRAVYDDSYADLLVDCLGRVVELNRPSSIDPVWSVEEDNILLAKIESALATRPAPRFVAQ